MKIDMVKYLAVLTAFMALGVANAGEIAKFMQETLAEQRARNAAEEQKATADALKTPEVPEFDLPKESIFTSKYKARDARYYKYDKSGRLVSVEYAATPAKNEYYTYDKQGNILEKKLGDKVYKYTYDSANQLLELNSPDGKREYFYDQAGRLVMEKLNGEIDVQYTYGYLDKVIEIDRRGKITKFAYDGFGMLASKTLSDGTVENWVWDGLALIRRGDDIYVNEPHISGGVPIVSKTKEGVRYHEHDFLGTTLWSMDTKGKVVKDYQDTTIFGEGSIQHDRSARFTGKPYDEDLQAYVFPNRIYDPTIKRWRSSDPSGYPDGINSQFYAVIPTIGMDPLGLKTYYIGGAFEFDGPYHPMANATCAKCGAPLTNQNEFKAWDSYDEIMADISATKAANPDEPINLVGHSYGGDTAYLVARDSSYNIDNLVTLDPVSHFTYDVSKPSQVENWNNVYSNPNNYGVDDFIADIGGQWGPVGKPGVNDISSTASHGSVGSLFNALPDNIKSQVHICEK